MIRKIYCIKRIPKLNHFGVLIIKIEIKRAISAQGNLSTFGVLILGEVALQCLNENIKLHGGALKCCRKKQHLGSLTSQEVIEMTFGPIDGDIWIFEFRMFVLFFPGTEINCFDIK